MVNGIDISSWQPYIDWGKVREDSKDIKFVFIKRSEGLVKTTTFESQFKGAGSINLFRGAYHYWHLEYPAIEQAKTFTDNLPQELDFLVVDIEDNDSLPADASYEKKEYAVRHIKEMLDEVERITGRKAIIYTAAWFWSRLPKKDWFKDHKLWVALYKDTSDGNPFKLNGKDYPVNGWDKWLFWQYSDSGRVEGITTSKGTLANVDMNIFNGSYEELCKLAGREIPEKYQLLQSTEKLVEEIKKNLAQLKELM